MEGGQETQKKNTKMRTGCLSNFPIAVISHCDQGNLQNTEFMGGLEFQRIVGHHHHGREYDNRQIGMVLEQQLRADILKHNPEAKGGTIG